MFKCLLLVIALLFLLSGCGSSDSTSSTSSTTSKAEIASKETNNSSVENDYKEPLTQSRDAQSRYIESLPSEQRQGVQTPFSAMIMKAEEPKSEFPQDEEEIEGALSDLLKVEKGMTDATFSSKIMEEYTRKTGITYLQGTPATQRKYYNYSVPDELLPYIFLDEKQLSFKFYEYTIGEGEQYLLNDCYVNEAGTELVLFVEKDGQRYVLQSTQAPDDQKLTVSVSSDETLLLYMN